MEFRLLGPIEVWEGEDSLRLPPRKQRALLALLALHANRVVARERLIDQLWGEEPPGKAVATLQVYVSQLRKLLPTGMLVTRPPGYVLEVEPETVDLGRFERLVADARAAAPMRAAVLLREALGLWRGPALAEFVDEPFARVQAASLEELRLAALEERIDADLALGRHAELAAELEALVASQPHRERLRGQLMLSHYRAGRQADALEAFRAARVELDQLGLEPGVALRQLERQILTQDPALDRPRERVRAEPIGLPGPLMPESPFPFVGRGGELGELRALLARAEAGEGGLALVTGEAGAGKTRLARELAREAVARSVLVLYGASDAAVTLPYQPLREWLEFLLRRFDTEALRECLGGCEVLGRLVPELVHLTGPPPPPADSEGDRYLIQKAVVELFRRLSEARALLVVADDIHWADGETLLLLGRMARVAPESRLLVLAGYRDRGEEVGAELAGALADLMRLEGVARIALGRLTDEEVGDFVHAAAEAAPARALVSVIGELTSGTPLLVCELWRDLRESGGVEIENAALRLTRPTVELRGPERVRDIVRERLLRLGPEIASTLELAAVASPRFELGVLSDAAKLRLDALVVAVEEAVHRGMLEELPGRPPAYRFTHELVRRAVYDRVAGMRRAALHLRVGEALERAYAAEPTRVLSELAHHFTLGAPVGGAEHAIHYNLRAANAAIEAVAYGEAAARLSSALELGIADPRTRARVQIELSYLLRETGRADEAKALLAASLNSASGHEERAVAANLLLHRDVALLDPHADPARMQATLERAIDSFRELGDWRGLAVAEARLGLTLRRRGCVAESCAVLERALVDARAHRVARGNVVGVLVKGLCYGPTPVPDAIERCNELLESDGRDHVLEAVIHRSLSALLAMAGRLDEALELVRRSSVVLEEVDHPIATWVNLVVAAEAKELAGDTAGAEADLRTMWEWVAGNGHKPIDVHGMDAAHRLAHLCCDQGRWDEAEHWLGYGADVPAPDYFLIEAVVGLAARARVAAHRCELDRAVVLAHRAVELAEQSDMLNLRARVRLALAEVKRQNDAAAESEVAVVEALRLYEAKGNIAAARGLRDSLVA